jgi:uncharacterized protein (DUF1501 family)
MNSPLLIAIDLISKATVLLLVASIANAALRHRPTDNAPQFTTDFRRVYATILQDWLEIPSDKLLRGRFDPLQLLS